MQFWHMAPLPACNPHKGKFSEKLLALIHLFCHLISVLNANLVIPLQYVGYALFCETRSNVNIPSMFCLYVVDKIKGPDKPHLTEQIALALQKWLNIGPRRPAMENWHPIRDRPMKYSLHVPLSLLKSIGDCFFPFLMALWPGISLQLLLAQFLQPDACHVWPTHCSSLWLCYDWVI